MLNFSSLNLCSNAYTSRIGTNLLQATEGVIAEVSPDSRDTFPGKGKLESQVIPLTQDGKANRNSLINAKKLSLDVSELPVGKYVVQLKDPKTGAIISSSLAFTIATGNKVENIGPGISNFPRLFSAPNFMTVLYNINKPTSSSKQNLATGASTCGNNEGQTPCPPPSEECDQRASPLMIDTESAFENSRFIMSAPLDGVRFDITGTGVASQISWPTQPGRARFLVLPNARGSVESIDELFGDNTTGPDGNGAANGFEALAKYDLNRDGVINIQDSIYGELALWADINRNARVDSGELVGLLEKGIKTINLKYQQVHDEDTYGNQTRQRSTVETDKGFLRMIVDIWFRPIY